MKRKRRWTATSGKGQWASRVTLPSILRWAFNEAAFEATDVTVKHDGRVVGVLTAAMMWTHLTDARLTAAIERFEVEGR